MNRSAWRSQSSVKERCASRPAQWITVREREIIRHTPSHAAPQQNTLDPQTHTSQGLVLRAFSAFRNETQSARSHMYIGIRDGYLPGGGPYVHAFISVIHHASPHRVGGHTVCSPRARLISQPGTTLFFRVHQWTTDHSWHSRAMHSASVSPSIVMVDIKQTWVSKHTHHAAQEM